MPDLQEPADAVSPHRAPSLTRPSARDGALRTQPEPGLQPLPIRLAQTTSEPSDHRDGQHGSLAVGKGQCVAGGREGALTHLGTGRWRHSRLRTRKSG